MEAHEFSTDVVGGWTIGSSTKDLVRPGTGMPVGGKACIIISWGQRCVSPSVLRTSSTAGLPLVLTVEAGGVSIGHLYHQHHRVRSILTVEVFDASIGLLYNQHH